MADPFAISDMRAALATRAFPTMVLWNRLEGRPRTHDFDRALAAEVRDALWMLTRQWQVGELRGDDAGSPVTVQVQVDRVPVTRLQRGESPPAPLDPSVLLEAAVERRPLPLTRDGVPISLDLRLMLGRQWLQITADIGYGDAFVAAYGFEMPDPARPEHAALCANLETWQAFTASQVGAWTVSASSNTCVSAGAQPYDGVAGVDPTDRPALELRATEFKTWVAALIHVPSDEQDDAWTPDRLEYRFKCAAGDDAGEQVYTARGVLRRLARLVSCRQRAVATLDLPRGAASAPRARYHSSGHAARAGDICRNAEQAMVGDGGWSHEFRQRASRHHRSREADADRVRPGLRQRLVRRAVHPASGIGGVGARARRHQYVRRAALDRAGESCHRRAVASLRAVRSDADRRGRRSRGVLRCCCCRLFR